MFIWKSRRSISGSSEAGMWNRRHQTFFSFDIILNSDCLKVTCSAPFKRKTRIVN